MKHIETVAKSASTPRTGLFAALGVPFHVRGSGTPKTGRGAGVFSVRRAGRTFQPLSRLKCCVPALLCAVVGLLAFTSAPALAAGGHVFKESFNGGVGHELSDPTGVAVNNATGDVYVVDKGNSRVVEFDPTGTKVLAEFGTSGELSEPEAIAIDNSGRTASEDPSVGDVYVTDHTVVDKFEADGTYLGQIATGEGGAPFAGLEGVAVDPKGQVWVYQENFQIDAFSDAAENAFLSSRKPKPSNPSRLGLAVNSEDDLFVAHAGSFEISEIDSMGQSLEGGDEEGRTGVAVESTSNDIYIDKGNPEEGAPEIQVYAQDGLTQPGQPTIETFGEAQLADHGGTALAVSYANVSSGDVYVVDSAGTGKIDIFTPPKVTAYAEIFSFGSKGAEPGKFQEPLGIAVDDTTEDVYVVDKGNKRVEEFNSTGTTVLAEFNGAATPTGAFYEPEAIAVDNCKNGLGEPCSALEDPSVGDVYVTEHLPHGNEPGYANPYSVYKFSSTGAYLGQLRRCLEDETSNGGCTPVGHPTSGFSEQVNGVMVDHEGNVWVGYTHGYEGGLSYEFSDTGTFIESPTSAAPGRGVDAGYSALDPSTGELFVDMGNSIDRYASESSPSPLESFPSAGGLQESSGIVVSPAGTVYATELTADDVKAFDEFPLPQVAVGTVASLRPTSVTLQGSVNPEGLQVSSCEFEYGTTTAYGQIVACEQSETEIGEGTKPVLVSAKLSGLPSGTTYHYRLVASSDVGTNRGSDHVVITPGPSVTEEQAGSVEAKAATLQVTIDPDGGATSYHFEYDTRPYGAGEGPHGTSLPVPSAAIGAGTSPVPVSVVLQELEPGKTYYYRAVAEGEPLGTPEAFYGINKTFATNPGTAPVQSCPNEQLRAEQPFGLTLPDCRAYELVSPEETGGQDATDSFSDPNARASVCGKECEERGDPAVTYASKGSFGEPTGATREDQFVSRRNAKAGRWETQAVTPLWNPIKNANQASFEATVFTPELEAGIAATNASLLNSGAPTSIGGEFGLYVSNFATGSYQYVGPAVRPQGASTDLSHVVFAEGDGNKVFEWVDGQVMPVNVTNGGAGLPASVGSAAPGTLRVFEKDAWHAVSADGSRVYFTSPGFEAQEGPGRLYLRENAEQAQSPMKDLGLPGEECEDPVDACTVKVSAGNARYWGASANGEKVFYTEGEDLYEYELPVGDVTGHATALTHAGKVQGVVQISEHGSYVYFVADGVLAPGASQGSCLPGTEAGIQSPEGATCNLYLYHDGETKFIATLEGGDESDWDRSLTEGGPEINTAVVNPSGTHLAFLSRRELTGYDDHDLNTGDPDAEIFLYEAGAGSLVCASCNPTGARPLGPSSFDPDLGIEAGNTQYRLRNLLADGTLFFDSSDALVPHSSDGRQNVYEYEEGQIHAISNVAGGEESFFLDASPSGEDVFFGSANKLLPQDTSDNVVVWDARKDGGFPVAVAALPCTTTEACRAASPPTPSVFGTPPSATFSGPGNIAPPPPAVVKKVIKKTAAQLKAEKLAKALKQCAKDKQKSKRAKCQKQARSKYGAKKAKKSSHDKGSK